MNRPALRLLSGRSLARAGQYTKAVKEIDDLISDARVPGDLLYDAARFCGVTTAAVQKEASLKEQYARNALAFLRRAQAAGDFRDAKDVEHFQNDDDLAAFCDRADYKAFAAELLKQLLAKPQGVPIKPK